MRHLDDLSEREIARRLPVWVGLADLYLDCDRDEIQIRSIADKIRDAGYTLPEVESILRYEVAPVFIWNGLAAGIGGAGVWDLWLDDYVREMVLTRLGRFRLWERIPLWRDLWYGYQMWFVKKEWIKVAARLAAEAKA